MLILCNDLEEDGGLGTTHELPEEVDDEVDQGIHVDVHQHGVDQERVHESLLRDQRIESEGEETEAYFDVALNSA